MPSAARKPDLHRVMVATLLTPLLPAFYAAILLADPWLLPLGLCAAFPCELLVGLPLALLLRARGQAGATQTAFAGATAAIPAVVAYAWLDPVPHAPPFDSLHAVYVLAWGAFAGACFWLIAFAGESPLRWRDLFDMGPPG
jgi:hypothetical protein